MIIRSAGFVDASLIGSQNALNFAYILYLTLRQQGIPNADIERTVRRWYVFSMLTGVYSGNPELGIYPVQTGRRLWTGSWALYGQRGL